MKTRTLLVNPEYIKNNSTVSDNMEDEYIIPSIIDAQLSGLQPLIGTALYDALCTKVENGTLTGDYKALVDDYISLYLLYKTIENMTIDNYQRQHNAGSVAYTDTNYTQVPLNDLKYMTQHWSDKAAFYGNRTTDYLHANHAKFPEYTQWKQGDLHKDELSPVRRCGIGLGIKESMRRKDR